MNAAKTGMQYVSYRRLIYQKHKVGITFIVIFHIVFISIG